MEWLPPLDKMKHKAENELTGIWGRASQMNDIWFIGLERTVIKYHNNLSFSFADPRNFTQIGTNRTRKEGFQWKIWGSANENDTLIWITSMDGYIGIIQDQE